MSVVVIGDRAVGKSHMALALADPNDAHKRQVVIIDPSYKDLKDKLQNYDTGLMVPTREITPTPIKIKVKLSKQKIIDSVWIDTMGEIWETDWQKDNVHAWSSFKQTIGESQGIILLLPPYQEIVSQELINRALPGMSLVREDLMNTQKWQSNLEDWLIFLNQNCSRVNHIIICLHKADLFCTDLDLEAKKIIGRRPGGRQEEIRKSRYFTGSQKIIDSHNRQERPFQFFVTSIRNPDLLTAPWLYLSPYILYHS